MNRSPTATADHASGTSPVKLHPNSPRQTSANPPNRRQSDGVVALSYVIISGGTGANSIASAFGHSPAFVLPVSDDGGSSSEILRCFGGPSIGDIRSRLIRLIPLPDQAATKAEKERMAIYNLMSFRFPAAAAEKEVRGLWMEIVEGKSELWNGIGGDKKECIRAFLVHFQTLCLRRAHKRFSFRNFSLGNGFLTGARDLFGSLPSAVFLFKSIAQVNAGVQVIPAINTNQTVTIAAQLANATTLVGQCTISHPTPPSTPLAMSAPTTPLISPVPHRQTAMKVSTHIPPYQQAHARRDSRRFDTEDLTHALESAVMGSEEEWTGGNLSYRKGEGEIPLEGKIERVFYINLYGQEIFPEPNPEFLEVLDQRNVLVYSCGSLWTSIAPCVALRGVATAIATSHSLKARVVLMNAMNDRETSSYTAADYVASIIKSLRDSDRPRRPSSLSKVDAPQTSWEARRLISHVAYLEGARVQLGPSRIEAMGITIIRIPASVHKALKGETPFFNNEIVEWTMARIMEDCAS